MQYSIHRCLTELKLLDDKINKAVYKRFIGYKKNSANGEYNTHDSDEDFTKLVQSNYDTVIAYINRRKQIKEAVVNSNAKTIVTIAGKEYTVASAIERKKSIKYEEELLHQLRVQYANSLRTVNDNNERMENNLDKQISQMVGSDNSKNDDISTFAEFYRKQNGYTLLDPLKLKDKIDILEKEIQDFNSEVDCVLSESNAITMVEIQE